MEYVALGNTGLDVSIAGLGAGGYSALGLRRGKTEAEAAGLVCDAFDLGVTFFDTAAAYPTESVVGKAVRPFRDQVVLSTKGHAVEGESLRTSRELEDQVYASLRTLETEWIDVYLLHAVAADDYDRVRAYALPVLDRLRQAGVIRAIGITEAYDSDPAHAMIRKAAPDGAWDVLMAGYNLANQGVRPVVPEGRTFGMIGMCAVRDPDRLRDSLGSSLDDLVDAGEPDELTDLAYRFARSADFIDSVVFGTSDRDHLVANIRSLTRPALGSSLLSRLEDDAGLVSQ